MVWLVSPRRSLSRRLRRRSPSTRSAPAGFSRRCWRSPLPTTQPRRRSLTRGQGAAAGRQGAEQALHDRRPTRRHSALPVLGRRCQHHRHRVFDRRWVDRSLIQTSSSCTADGAWKCCQWSAHQKMEFSMTKRDLLNYSTALGLHGGGTLGTYQVGVYRGMKEHGYEPTVITD